MDKNSNLNFWQIAGLTVSIVGVAGSLTLLLNAAQNTPVLVLILMMGWILAPFIGLFVAHAFSKHWSTLARTAVYVLMFGLTIISLIGFSGLLNYEGMKPAFMFVLIPGVCWILIALTAFIVRRQSRSKGG